MQKQDLSSGGEKKLRMTAWRAEANLATARRKSPDPLWFPREAGAVESAEG